jgi:hypothetical protein
MDRVGFEPTTSATILEEHQQWKGKELLKSHLFHFEMLKAILCLS